MVYTHFGLVKGATIPKHIISSVRERSALEVAKAELRASLESEAPFGGKASWLELLKPLAKRVLEDIMDVELSEFLQASKSERTAQRRGCRNGYREVTLKSSTLGRLELSVPRDRDGNFNSRLLEKCPRVERSMLIALAEGYTQGLSTRKVVAFLNRLGLGDMSKSQLSRLRKKMDASLALTVNRPLRGECYEYLMCDALYSKARVDSVARASACYIVIGIDGEGRRRLLALEVGDEETTANWSQVFQGLKRRGLGPVSYVVADQHAGLQEALGRELGSVAVQRYVFHWLHNAGTRLPKKQAHAVLAQLSGFFNAQDIGQARQRIRTWLACEQARQLPQLAEWVEETVEDCLVCYALPPEHRKPMRTTNWLERVNQEVRRRIRPMRALPNRQSLWRIAAAVLIDLDEKWTSQSWRYLTTPPQALRPNRSRTG